MLPKQKDIEIPLLEVLVEIGGQGKPKEIYALVTKKFPYIREEDLAEVVPSGDNRWTNRVQWARQALVDKGEIDSSGHGIWRITDKGRKRLADLHRPGPETMSLTFLELYKNYEASFQAQLLETAKPFLSRVRVFCTQAAHSLRIPGCSGYSGLQRWWDRWAW